MVDNRTFGNINLPSESMIAKVDYLNHIGDIHLGWIIKVQIKEGIFLSYLYCFPVSPKVERHEISLDNKKS